MDEHPFSLWLYYIIENSGKLLYLQHLTVLQRRVRQYEGPAAGMFFCIGAVPCAGGCWSGR